MRRTALAGSLGLLGVLLLCATGCGGGGDSTTVLSKAEFKKSANSICASATAEYRKKFFAYAKKRRPKTPAEVEQAQAVVTKTILVPIMLREAEELKELAGPAKDEAQVAAIATAYEEGSQKAEEQPQRAARDSTEASGKARRMANEYGLKCE